MLINANVKKVVYGTLYPDKEALNFFEKAGVEVEQLTLKNP
jgi:deoxycytidylate deaminase